MCHKQQSPMHCVGTPLEQAWCLDSHVIDADDCQDVPSHPDSLLAQALERDRHYNESSRHLEASLNEQGSPPKNVGGPPCHVCRQLQQHRQTSHQIIGPTDHSASMSVSLQSETTAMSGTGDVERQVCKSSQHW